MRHLLSLLVFAALFTTTAFAAQSHKPKKVHRHSASATAEKSEWNEICQDLLDTSVKSTWKLEKSVKKKKKISKKEFESKIQNELMVVQLNAWVCALSSKKQAGVAAEELFLQDYSRLVQGQKL